jgi:methionyl-tRNA formyltransferase
MKDTRIAFFGSPRLARSCLEELHRKIPVKLVVTQPDREKGRGKSVSATPVKEFAGEHHVHIYQKRELEEDLLDVLREREIDLIVVVAFGRILSEPIISCPRYGSLNLHASLLPKFRGPSPIEAALLAGESATGVSLQIMTPEIDRGDILASRRITIDDQWTAEHLHEELIRVAPPFLSRSVGEYIEGRLKPRPQFDRCASYCRTIRKQDGCIDWNEAAHSIRNRVRAYSIWPVAFSWLDGRLLRLYNAHILAQEGERAGTGKTGEIVAADRKRGLVVKTGEGYLSITDLQLENKRRMDYRDFVNGFRNLEGTLLGKATDHRLPRID